MNRRDALRALGSIPAIAAAATLAPTVACNRVRQSIAHHMESPVQTHSPAPPVRNQPSNFNPSAESFLDELSERTAHYFLEQADPVTGLIFDRAHADGSPLGGSVNITSTAANGFGLSVLCVAAQRGYLDAHVCQQRILGILDFFAHKAQHRHGFFPHYFDARTGNFAQPAEFSSMDTALLLAGILHARHYLNSARVDTLANLIYSRVDWPWMLNGGDTLAMGWREDIGFLPYRWNSYSECLLMYLLAIGSPTHPLPPKSWNAIQRNMYDYGGIRFISSYGALFIHQYLHIWTDLRDLRDDHANYVTNSISAIRAHKTWCMLQHGRFSWVDERVWGFSASDTPHGSYAAWAAPPVVGDWDGTLSPHAAGGSFTLLPEESIVVLTAMRDHYTPSFTRYGFVDAFRPATDSEKIWFDPDVIAIDLALTMLMAENHRSGAVREAGMHTREIANAIHAVGFDRSV